MKVAIVSIRFDTKGGSERRTYQLARGLIGAGHDVEVFAAEVEDMDLPARVSIVPMMPGPSFMKVRSFSRNVNRMLSGRPDIDVIHNQIRPYTDGIVTVGGGCHAEYLERSGKTFGFLNPLNRVVLGMERERYKAGGCRAVITNSEFARKGLLKHYPIPPERVFVAYNGVDNAKFNPERITEYRRAVRAGYGYKDEPVALFVGTGFERKGLSSVIRALAVVKGMEQEINRLRLLVVGKDDPGPYERLANGLGVSERVTFAGATAEPEKFYGAADIFVLPTQYDPFSNATLEAMASGLPVVTTKYNGVSDIINDGENGLVVNNADNPSDIAAALSYLSCEKVRREMGARARKTAEGLTWDKTLEKTLDVYRNTLAV